ncbi:putative uncharacterized protein [Clostridium sp. CAG:356]|jgi:hypothetical protein|nr:MAG: hypothetical protein BHW02_04360 [Clostridium sp. 28_12]CDD37119.1 putative uncharacterized protein [Clostridium sp. CAG:356]
MIDKKKLKKSLLVLLLISIIIVAIILIRNTLARYETTATSDKDVDVAFWMLHDDFKTGKLLIKDIYPSNNTYEYSFSVSNFQKEDDGTIKKRAETDLEYGLTLTMTTNLPLEYQIEKNGEILDSEAAKQEIITDDDGTYYKKISIAESQMNQGVDSTDKYVIKVRFPKENDTNAEYSDLIEYIKLDLSAKQIID